MSDAKKIRIEAYEELMSELQNEINNDESVLNYMIDKIGKKRQKLEFFKDELKRLK